MGKLDGKIALITGGTTGIGFATAQLFLKEGAQVVVTGRNLKAIEEAQKALGAHALAIASDANRLTDTDALMKTISERFGRIDIVFANAGIAEFAPVEQVDENFFDRQFDINVKGVFFTVQKSLPLLPEGGAVLLNASVVWKKGFPTTSIYAATKAAVRSFGRTMARELAPRRIRVNTISPGPTATPRVFARLGIPREEAKGLSAELVDSIALKRLGRPEEIANLALFLASDDASFITGAEIFADGGFAEL